MIKSIYKIKLLNRNKNTFFYLFNYLTMPRSSSKQHGYSRKQGTSGKVSNQDADNNTLNKDGTIRKRRLGKTNTPR